MTLISTPVPIIINVLAVAILALLLYHHIQLYAMDYQLNNGACAVPPTHDEGYARVSKFIQERVLANAGRYQCEDDDTRAHVCLGFRLHEKFHSNDPFDLNTGYWQVDEETGEATLLSPTSLEEQLFSITITNANGGAIGLHGGKKAPRYPIHAFAHKTKNGSTLGGAIAVEDRFVIIDTLGKPHNLTVTPDGEWFADTTCFAGCNH